MPKLALTKAKAWAKALRECADPPRATQHLELLAGTAGLDWLSSASPSEARVLAAVLSGSQALSAWLVAEPALLEALRDEALKFPRRMQGIRSEIGEWLPGLLKGQDYAGAFRRVRQLKKVEMLRIAARDLGRRAKVEEIILELSNLADVCLETVWRILEAQFHERYGRPYHQELNGKWRETPACVLGMGKLGGQELNYSSDVDVLFAYAEEGAVFKDPPGPMRKSGGAPGARPAMNNHQFFNRLAEAFIAEIARMTPEGTLYRIDLRLRPEGETAPLSRSLTSYENYYAQWGQTWERMMLIKARGIAGQLELAAEFLEMVQPFRYPRSISSSVIREIADMKDRIEQEVVKAGELDRNVKLGRGGIREIEFVAQSLQLLHAGKQPFLQGAQTLPCLEKLVQYELLLARDAQELGDAYRFLRDVEHRLQMEDNLQTHTIPAQPAAQQRLARLMGYGSRTAFEAARSEHAGKVRRVFDRLFKADSAAAGGTAKFPRQFAGAETHWRELLAGHGFRDAEKALRVLRELVEGPGYVHVSPRTVALAHGLLPRLFALCPAKGLAERAERGRHERDSRGAGQGIPLSDPDRVVTRLDSFIAAYGARATLFELWNSNPSIFELLLLLFDRSEFLAELAIRTPDLVDELVTSGRLSQRKAAAETLRDLRHGLEDADQHLWMRRYHQAELMRIGLRDILGLADFEQYLVELSALADACLQYALEVVMRKNKLSKAPFAVIGLGKLGGVEIDYGSDLDIIFVAGNQGRNLARLSAYAVQVLDLLSSRTEQGILFHTDARLRPDGEKGLLVNTLKAYEDYYRSRAQLWEIQALSRSRPIAGDEGIGRQFQQLAARLTNFQKPSLPLAAYQPNWKQQIHHMRMRIERERTPAGKDDLAIKTGSGGLVDAEFIAQALCLEHGWQEANTLRVLEKAAAAGVLPDAARLIANYREIRRVEGILRRWSYEGETVLPDDPAPFYRVAVRCGFASPEAFRESIGDCRKAVRECYVKALL